MSVKLGAFRSFTAEQEHGNQNCDILTNADKRLSGCEDIARFEDGSLVLSCVDRTPLLKEIHSNKEMTQIIEENSRNQGYLFMMKHINAQVDNKQEFVELRLLNRVSPDFYPHGVSVITDHINRKWIFVVNHRRDGDVVEIYQLNNEQTAATFIDEVHSPLFVGINDVKPVILRNEEVRMGFYVTNSAGFRFNSFLSKLEIVLALKMDDLIFCEPDTRSYEDRYNNKNIFKPQWLCRVVDTPLAVGNGVDISIDGTQVYVVQTYGPNIIVYDRDKSSNTLIRNRTISLPSAGDNLYLDRNTGDLYIGCHPNFLSFMQYMMRITTVVPSQVLHWDKETGKVSEIYLSNGHNQFHVSGSSVGVFDAQTKTLLIGTVNGGTMRCKL